MLTRSLSSEPLSPEWKDRLDLGDRTVPELYEDPGSVRQSPHANALRTILEDLNASAVLCVQGAPTVVIFSLEHYEQDVIIDLHGALWNQGLASLLLVLSDNIVRAFSLVCAPCTNDDDQEFERRCLIQTLDVVTEALAIKDLIYGSESGRLWERHARYFEMDQRIDQVLLKNLVTSHAQLCQEGLSEEASQALLIQTMFVAYLEDRGIVGPEYFKGASDGRSGTLLELLESASPETLDRLFDKLHTDFNGDLFVDPCSFHAERIKPSIMLAHLRTLARFRSGREVMGTSGSQLRFWGYDFKYVPIELMSAVYDHFLGTQKVQRHMRGAYYTPMFVADTVISALWDTMSETTKTEGRFLDPACGSGVFLVRSFQLLCEYWRDTHKSRAIRWNVLLKILSRLSGYDINAGAVRVAVFSLYVALLEEVTPSDLLQLSKEKRFLPKLWDRTLRAQDFFQASENDLKAEVILGIPPWSSRHGESISSIAWCQEHQVPTPSREVAWAFVWKSLEHLENTGIVGFLLPAMGFLHNHAKSSVQARIRLVENARIHRIINLADLRVQLFEGSVRATALVILGKRETNEQGYRFDYWVPKADLNLKMRRAITISSMDRTSVTSFNVRDDPFVFKHRLWLSNPEAKLFGFLKTLPTLDILVNGYRQVYRMNDSTENQWIVGNGFKPVNVDRLVDDNYQRLQSEAISTTPYLPIEAFRPLAQDSKHLSNFNQGVDGWVHRKGFERGFTGIRVLVPKGISTLRKRLRACYSSDPLTFTDTILAISVPKHETYRAKLLTALLNSKLLYWFAFHGTTSFGSGRPRVKKTDLLRLPFPSPTDFLHEDRSSKAARGLVSIIDNALAKAKESFDLVSIETGLLDQLDSLCYEYFGLNEEEVSLVEDSVANLIPNVQPHAPSSINRWQPASLQERAAYANTLTSSMTQWFSENSTVRLELEAKNEDLALLRIRLTEQEKTNAYTERNDQNVGVALTRLRGLMDRPLPGDFHLVPDFRVFIEESLYLVKPLQRRFWMKSSAIVDADAIAMDLQETLQFQKLASPN